MQKTCYSVYAELKMEASNATKVKARRKETKSDASAGEVSVGHGDQRLREGVTGNNTSLRESELHVIEILTEQNRLQASRIQRMEADSSEDQENFKTKLQECQSKVDSLESEKQTFLERIEILTEQNKRQPTFREQVAYILSHPAKILCILALIVGVCLHLNNMVSENHLLRERNGDLTEDNDRKFSQIEDLEIDSNEQRGRFDIQFQEQKVKLDAMNSENLLLREDIEFSNKQNAALTEKNYRKSSRIEQLEKDSKGQRDRFDIQLREQKVKLDAMNSENLLLREDIKFANKHNGALTEQINRQSSQIKQLEKDSNRFDIQLREQKVKLDAMNSENRLLRDQIAFASQQTEFLQSQMTSMRVEFKENNDKITAVRLQESQFNVEGMNYLVRCLRDEDSASERFNGISLFWGAVKVGRTTRSGLDNCLTMYQAHYNQRILL